MNSLPLDNKNVCLVWLIFQITPYGKETCEITIRVSLANRECLQEKVTADKAHTCVLLIGDLDNNVIYRVRIR